MGFSEKFIKNASDIVKSKTVDADYEYIEDLLKQAVERVAVSTPYFDPKDVKIFLQGSYLSRTNTAFQSKLEVVVEIKKIKDFDSSLMRKEDFIIHDNFFIEFNHFFDVKRFKNALITELKTLTKQSIKINPVTFSIPAHKQLRHIVDIFPCFTYKFFNQDGGQMTGKLVHNKVLDEHYLIFTNLHSDNGELKNELTKGKFKDMVRLFKTLIAISEREDLNINPIRGYYTECLLYNVPNEIYYTEEGTLLSTFLKVINWLNFTNLDDFVCQNQIWSLWGTADGFWNKAAAKQFINDVIEFYDKFPSKRTEIVKDNNDDSKDN